MLKRTNTLSLTIAACLIAATAALGQQSSTNNSQSMQNMRGMQMQNGQMQKGKTSMNQMMQGCHKHMQSTMQSNAKTIKDIEAAKRSNDPVKMRSALDEAKTALSQTNEHMKGCMMMMNMMQNMHGKGMGNMHGKGMGNMQDNGQQGVPRN